MHTLDADIIFNMSGPAEFKMDAANNFQSILFDKDRFKESSGISDFVLGGKNIGLGVDIGVVYDISDRLKVSAAVTDIGYIKWKKEVSNLRTKGKFEFSGINIVDVINGIKTFEEVADETLDSLKNEFKATESNVPFTTYLPFGVTLGGSFDLTKSFSLGLLSYSRVIGKQVRESLTLSANMNLGNALSASISYTAANHRYDNLGAGLSFRAGIFQFYALSDRIPVMWDRIKDESNNTILLPSSWNTVNLRLGMNLVFGNKNKKKNDKPMVVIE